MSARRTRATSRREESPESQESPVTRRTRNGAKRADVSVVSPQSKSEHSESRIPQRGTRRKGIRRSVESIATTDFPKSSAEHAVPEVSDEVTAPNLESQGDSYEDRVARLQDILDFDLPKLDRWCGKAYEVLSSLTQPEPTVEERKILNTTRKAFRLACRPLADDGTAYIDLSSSDLPYRDDPDTDAAIRRATCSANLISLLLTLADVKCFQKAALTFLRELDDAFSISFSSVLPLALGGDDLAFRIRCRRLVELLGEERETEPLVLATEIFCTQPATTPREAAQELRKGALRKFGRIEQGGDFTYPAGFATQMEDVIATLSLPQRAETEELLNAAFPLDELLEELRMWALDSYMRLGNGEPDEGGSLPGSQNEGVTADSAKKESSEPRVSPDSESGSGYEGYQQLGKSTKEPSFIQGPATLAAVRRSEKGVPTLSGTMSSSNRQPARGKMTDSQIKDAVLRLDSADFLGPSNKDDEMADVTGPAAARVSPSRPQEPGAVGKRARGWEDEDYVDDDDDFEVNEQLRDESRRIRYEDADASKSIPKRHGRSGKSSDTKNGPRSPGNAPTSTNTEGEDLAAPSQAPRNNRPANARGHQIREKWSHADTEHLLDLIADEEINCSWAAMERKGGFRTYRDQQAIRDKARNLKKGYLCTDSILPRGFDNVYLGKKERDEVILSGHNPERKEADIDEEGNVTRNRWREDS